MQNFETLSLRFSNGTFSILDQTALPEIERWVVVEHPDQMVEIIKSLQVRGAPLIGVAAAITLALYAQKGARSEEILKAAAALRQSRPTAVNLMWALDQMLATSLDPTSLMEKAEAICEKERVMCDKMATYGAALIRDGENIITHCNTGGLATPGIGTALGVIHRAHEQGKKIHVYVDETRPLLQGGRLTAWELGRLGIPYTLICDNMAATLFREGKIDRALVGADRIAVNGDFANKIGTYSLAVNAHFHNVPFHPVAPMTTVDYACQTGTDIPIELRCEKEVQGVRDYFWAPKNAPCYNPAFDVTPVELVTSLILDEGIFDLKVERLP